MCVVVVRAIFLEEKYEEFSRENQIFITSHSPAFYDLGGEDVARWSVQSERAGPSSNWVTTATSISDAEKADRDLGIAALVANRARNLYDEIEQLQVSVSELEEKVTSSNKMQVIVEGPYDVSVLNTALQKRERTENCFEFVSGNGVNNVEAFITMLTKMHRTFSVPVIGLVDNDMAGRKVARKFSGAHRLEGTEIRILDRVQGIMFFMLPIPDEFLEARREFASLFPNSADIPLFIENIFPPKITRQA